MTPEETKTQALHAQHILEDPLVVGALDRLEHDLRDLWENSNASQVAEREEAWAMLRAAKLFRTRFEIMIREGVDQQTLDTAEEEEA